MNATRVLIALALFASYVLAVNAEQSLHDPQVYQYYGHGGVSYLNNADREKRFIHVPLALGIGAAGLFGAGVATGVAGGVAGYSLLHGSSHFPYHGGYSSGYHHSYYY